MALTQERLCQIYEYRPQTGEFIRLLATNNRVKVGGVCGFVDVDGYRRIRVDGKLYLAHRLAWFYMHGRWPLDEVDHRDGIRDNNRWSNLRSAGRFQNAWNMRSGKPNSTGYRGVSLNRKSGRYEAAIHAARQRHHLGTFDTPQEAHQAYCEASTRLHGEFGRTK